MKYISLLAVIVISFTACRKDNQNFKLKTVTINSYLNNGLSQQQIYVRIVDAADTKQVIGVSELYPSNLPLPVTLGVTSNLKQPLYKRSCIVQLWGSLSGLLSSQTIRMDYYKIVFPLEMEVKNEVMVITLSGSWD